MVCVPLVLCVAEPNQERMGSTAGLLSAIVGVMSARVEDADVQRAGLKALWELAEHGATQCGAHSVGVWRMCACVEQPVFGCRVCVCAPVHDLVTIVCMWLGDRHVVGVHGVCYSCCVWQRRTGSAWAVRPGCCRR